MDIGYSPPERSTEWPPPWLSPDLRTCAAVVAPWLMAWLRFMRCAHAGGADPVPPDPARPDASLAASASPPTVPMVEEPPVAAKTARAPEHRLSFIAPTAMDT